MAGERAVYVSLTQCVPFQLLSDQKEGRNESREIFDRESVCSGSRRGVKVPLELDSESGIHCHTHTHIHIHTWREKSVQKAGTAAGEKIH